MEKKGIITYFLILHLYASCRINPYWRKDFAAFVAGFLPRYPWNVRVYSLIMIVNISKSQYSHNQEIIQSVKKQQLYIAKQLSIRKNFIIKSIHGSGIDYNSRFYNQLLYNNGFYTIYSDSINFSNLRSLHKTNNSFDDFYFDISNVISNEYYDPQSFPPLKDSSSDNAWYWYYPNSDSLVLSYKQPPNLNNHKYGNRENILEIKSKIPSRYLFLQGNMKGLILFLLTGVMFYFLFNLFRTITYKLSLKRFIFFPEIFEVPSIYKLISEYRQTCTLENESEEKLQKLSDEYKSFDFTKKPDEIVIQERAMISLVKEYKNFYDFIWQKLSDKEKYLVYNFSKEGLMNFKNSVEIYTLMQKGILITIPAKEEMGLFSKSFKAFIIGFLPESELILLTKRIRQNSTWQSFRIPLLIIFLAITSFIFFTQQDIWQKLMALIAGFSSTIPLVLNIFSRTTTFSQSKNN